ncbi:MAG: hypothetical protein J7501_04420 [Bdellovibrio sp.]|nr:hypothetical protein [Bdellovibrio sp.]
MNVLKLWKFVFGLLPLVMLGTATAAPNMNTLFVQGYLRKVSGSAVSDGTYAMTFSLRSGSTYFWTKSASVAVSGGFFSQSLSGTSSSPYSGSIDSTTIANASAGGLVVNIQATVDGLPVSFDMQASPVALALFADKASTVVNGSIVSTSMASTGTMPAWDGSALTNVTADNLNGTLPVAVFPTTLPATSGANLTSLNATNITTGTLVSAVMPTTFSKNTTFNAAGTAVAITTNATVGGTLGVTGATTVGGTLGVTGTTTLGASTIVGNTLINNSGAGTTTIGGGSSTGAVTIGGSTSTGAITIGGGSSTAGITIGGSSGAQAVTVGGSGTGTVTVGNTGAASATVIQSGTSGKIKIGSSGVAVASMGACTIGAFAGTSGANAKTCTGLSTGTAVFCSPSASQGTTVVWSSFASAANTVTIVLSAAGVSATWYCMWVAP